GRGRAMSAPAGAAIAVVLPDGSRKELAAGATGADLAAAIGPRLAKVALAVRVDGELRDLSRPLPDGAQVAIVRDQDAEALDLMRHSAAHVMAQAVMDLYGKDVVRLGIGPTIRSGFYYDFDFTDGRRLKEEDLAAIEARMRQIVKDDEAFVREEVPREQALSVWGARGDRFKVDLIHGIPAGETISFYRCLRDGAEAFIDLCRGPHVPRTGRLDVTFKLLNVAGAYWQGDEHNPMMQRVYAACFRTQAELDAHLHNLEEAKRRDHRKLGRELKLFQFTDEVGPGLPLWLPRGTAILDALVGFLRAEQAKRGYLPVSTPHIARQELYQTSGHWQNYRESMFPLMGEDGHGAFVLKPMNCPHHIQIYKSELRSYRDLPLRLAEFGTVYRLEQSGELGGLKRVRGFTVDDAHLFVTPEQLFDEFCGVVELVKHVLKTLGLSNVQARVGLRSKEGGKWVGPPELWARAQEGLLEACRKLGLEHTVEEGEAAFYGPKLDFVVTDALDRPWQLGTAQVDYNLPERFDLHYTASDGGRKRPVMIHRAPFGSLERLMGVLIEHYGGAFPLWLAPIQVAVAPISATQEPAARELAERLEAEGLRVQRCFENEPIGARIRQVRLEKVPYMAILGAREIQDSTVSVRTREAEEGPMGREAFIARLRDEAGQRR
ncbi:MAG TPA: threonine--tRNA ligase, partial [Planctomycetota bacterium]|nr:threonine--tRNA ligase [Planctomycetota bacterium]